MCGQSGAAGSLFQPEKNTVEHLMTMNILRGPHSTGMAVIPRIRNNHQNVMNVKELGTPFGDGDGGTGIRGHKNYDKALRMPAGAILTHNRWATKGAISRKNAHPFWFPKLVGTHNGTLDYSYRTKLLRAEQFETDSECLFNTINCWGIRKAIENTEGAYALVWYDLENDTLNMLRNEKRPLHYAFDKDRNVLFWSSDFYALAYGMEQGRINRGEEKIYLLPVDSHLSWKLPHLNQPFGDPSREGLKGYEYKYTYVRGGFGRTQGTPFLDGESTALDDWYREEAGKSTESSGGTPETSESKTSRVIPDDGTTEDSKILETHYDHEKGSHIVVDRKGRAEVRKHLQPEIVDKLEEMAEKRFDEQFSSPLLVNNNLCLKASQPFKKCYYDKKEGMFSSYEYLTLTNKWVLHHSAMPPKWLPYNMINVEAGGSHLFSYQKQGRGKKKKRMIFYKGYQGKTLDRESFEGVMANGCLNCARTPTWGNEVKFVDSETFLCEHCMTPQLESLWKRA